MSWGTALERFLVGVGLAIAQNWMTVDKRFGSAELKAYLKLRRQYHPLFIGAAAVVANGLEDTRARGAIPVLRKLSKVPPGQEQKQVELGARAVARMGRLTVQDVEDPLVRKSLMPLRKAARVFQSMGEEGEGEASVSHEMVHEMVRASKNFFEHAVKFDSIPPKIKTLFRKMLKGRVGYGDPSFSTVARTGTWETLPPEEQERVRKEVLLVREKEEAAYQIQDIEERSREYRRLAQERTRLQNEVGINIGVIEQGEVGSVDDALKAEKTQERDALTEYVIDKFTRNIRDLIRNYPEQFTGRKREINKQLTRLGKVKTLATGSLVVRDAVQRGVVSKEWEESYDRLVKATEGNLAVQEGVAIAPLDWAPVDEETFLARHDVGEVRFGEGYTEKEKQEILGRVSRAMSDLETVYGAKVAGRHARKLRMEFEGGIGTSGGAAASYFGWDDRNKWQPRVRFGRDFDTLLAHELSHYFDDLMAYQIERKAKGADWAEYQYGDVAHGPGDIFGTTGVTLQSAAGWLDEPREGSWQANVAREVPELVEWVRAVNESPDHERWKDLVPGAYDMVMDRAVKDVLGDDIDWDELERIRNIRYKSELPPGVAERAEELYQKVMEGDTRGLRYNHSVVEVWAKMCEQYVYTKLSRDGIANPWLTRMSYDTRAGGTNEKFM
jgi:hypothetical protein